MTPKENVELVKIETEGTKEVHEIGLGNKAVLVAIGTALEDGWQPGTDLPSIIVNSIGPLGKAIDGAQKSGIEFKAYPTKATIGLTVPVLEGVESLLDIKKNVEA